MTSAMIMTDMPLLSIVTITKDNPSGFAKTSTSIAAQTFKDFEWVVVDGAVEPDNGIYDAMNKGLERSRGTYILFLNGGDAFADPETLTLIARHIESFPSDFIYGDAMEHDGKRYHVKKARNHTSLVRGMFTHHQAMIYKREIIGGLRFDTNYKIAGDYDFTARFLKKTHDVSYIPAPLCLFEQGGISQRQADLGRREEYSAKIRHEICSRLIAYLTYARQVFAMAVKKNYPDFYRLLSR